VTNARIITVFAAKGVCGKNTLATSLATVRKADHHPPKIRVGGSPSVEGARRRNVTRKVTQAAPFSLPHTAPI
jgi:hypothetical protein